MADLKTTAAMEAVYPLWDDLAQFPPDHSDPALERLCTGMKDLLKADNVKWVAAVRMLKDETFESDSMRGWRLRGKYDLVPDGESEVWIAEDPDHMIHFNGERVLGPYPDVMP